jgi:SAM-dependent methyltransferase
MTRFVPCPKCGASAPEAYRAEDYYKRMTDETFDYHRCPKDGLIFLHPIPVDLGRYYPNSYYELPQDLDALDRIAQDRVRWKLETVTRFAKSGSLLEIGPAFGLFSHLAKQSGFQVTAIEMDQRCCDFLRDVVEIDVVQSSDVSAALDDLPQFDVIVLWQVIEHLPDPWDVLSQIAARLAPGGILVLDTPNPEAFQFRVLGHRWVHLDPPRHVNLIPWRLMKDHLAAENLGLLDLTASDVGANGYNGFGWGVSFQNFFGDNALGRAVNFLGRALSKLLIPIERTGWRGSTYTAVFQKQVRS